MRVLAIRFLPLFLAAALAAASGSAPCSAKPAAAGANTLSAGAPTDDAKAVAKLLANVKSVQPGVPFRLGVELKMQPGWHSYYKDPGEAGMPTSIKWTLPPGFTASELMWEKPNHFDEQGINTFGYHDHTLIAATITPPKDLKAGTQLQFDAAVKWLTCKEICLPGKQSVSMKMNVSEAGVPAQKDNESAFAVVNFDGPISSISASQPSKKQGEATTESTSPKTTASSDDGPIDPTDPLDNDQDFKAADGGETTNLATALLFAMVGGFILNLMPCVLPVIAIKILSFLEQAHDEPARVRKLGLTFSAGITSTFLLLAGIVLGIQSAGQKIGWGFQFQYPGFIIAMSVVVLLLALSLLGLFYVSVNAGSNQLNSLANKDGFVGTFFKGVLATVLSTPCTAPFLGPVLGFAFTQGPLAIVAIFFAVGFGMSLPYLVLTAKPEWMKFIPKPGDWMEKLKESFGFVLLATVVWLLSVLGTQVGAEGVVWTVAFLLAVSFSAWIIARFTNLSSTGTRKATVWAVALAVSGTALYYFVATKPGIGFTEEARAATARNTAHQSEETGIWQSFNMAKLKEARRNNKTVMLDFTAQWCLTCKVNENGVLASSEIIDKLKQLNVVTMKVDWTNQDEKIARLLRKFHRSGVPLYVIFPAGKPNEPIVLPEVITKEIVLQALDKAGPSK